MIVQYGTLQKGSSHCVSWKCNQNSWIALQRSLSQQRVSHFEQNLAPPSTATAAPGPQWHL